MLGDSSQKTEMVLEFTTGSSAGVGGGFIPGSSVGVGVPHR